MLVSCKSQAAMDREAFRKAALACDVQGIRYVREANEEHLAESRGVWPFSIFGTWRLEQRARQGKTLRHYETNVPAAFVIPFSPSAAATRRNMENPYNRWFVCLSNVLAPQNIEIGHCEYVWSASGTVQAHSEVGPCLRPKLRSSP
jgi:hypothetical protein